MPPRPRTPLVALDANALDRDGSPRDALVDALLAAAAAGRLRLFVPEGVLAEMRGPARPRPCGPRRWPCRRWPCRLPRRRSRGCLAGARATARQHIDRIRVRAIMRGDGRPGKHDADASHLSEAAEAGCDAFLTRDGKVLRRRDVLRQALPPGLRIATLEDFMSGLARAAAGRAAGTTTARRRRPGRPRGRWPVGDGPSRAGAGALCCFRFVPLPPLPNPRRHDDPAPIGRRRPGPRGRRRSFPARARAPQDHPRRHGRLLRLGRAARRPRPARAARGGGRLAPARRGGGGELRGAALRRALGHVVHGGGAALPGPRLRAPALRRLQGGVAPDPGGLRRAHRADRAAVAGRGLPRRDRGGVPAGSATRSPRRSGPASCATPGSPPRPG